MTTFQCSYCNKTFKSDYNLKRHMTLICQQHKDIKSKNNNNVLFDTDNTSNQLHHYNTMSYYKNRSTHEQNSVEHLLHELTMKSDTEYESDTSSIDRNSSDDDASTPMVIDKTDNINPIDKENHISKDIHVKITSVNDLKQKRFTSLFPILSQ